MFELSQQATLKINEQRIREMHREAASNAAARHAGAGGSARRIARWLRSAATRIEGDVAYQPQANNLRSLVN